MSKYLVVVPGSTTTYLEDAISSATREVESGGHRMYVCKLVAKVEPAGITVRMVEEDDAS